MSVPVEAAGDQFSTDFYDTFIPRWQSNADNQVTFSMDAKRKAGTQFTLISPTTFGFGTSSQPVQGSDSQSKIAFQGTIKATWHGSTKGKLSGTTMVFVLEDGTPLNIDSGDVGVWQ